MQLVLAALPVVSGTAQQGQPLSVGQGGWSGNPTGFTYRWRQCDGGGSGCTDIALATSASYTPTVNDVGRSTGPRRASAAELCGMSYGSFLRQSSSAAERLEAALSYLEWGWALLPLWPRGIFLSPCRTPHPKPDREGPS